MTDDGGGGLVNVIRELRENRARLTEARAELEKVDDQQRAELIATHGRWEVLRMEWRGDRPGETDEFLAANQKVADVQDSVPWWQRF